MVADAIFEDGLISLRDTLEKVPSVIRIIPCAAANIMVAWAGKLLVSKAICITAKVCQFLAVFARSHLFVVKIIMRIYVFDEVMATLLHLTTRIR